MSDYGTLTIVLTVLAVIAAWLPFVIAMLRPTKVYGRLVSQAVATRAELSFTDREQRETKLQGTQYVFKIALVALNHNYPVRGCHIFLKYKDSQPAEGKLFWAESSVFAFPPPRGKRC